MITVSFPYVENTFKAALAEVINPYLATGDQAVAGGVEMDFYNCDIHYNIDMVRAPSEKPRIGILGTRSNIIGDEKCIDPSGVLPLGYVRRLGVYRSIYVSAPRDLQIQDPPYSNQAKRVIGWEDMDKIWSQVHAVLSTKFVDLMTRGIYRPSLTPTPIAASDTQYLILYGVMECEVRFSMVRG